MWDGDGLGTSDRQTDDGRTSQQTAKAEGESWVLKLDWLLTAAATSGTSSLKLSSGPDGGAKRI